MGGFADMYGEDFLGLRELGIASELGVSSLSVPKKLLRPKGARMGAGSSLPCVEPLFVSSSRLLTCGTCLPCRSKPTEPPPPFPPPPPFVLLESTRMEDEIIGLLRPFYKTRFDALAQSQTSLPKSPLTTTDGTTAAGDPSTSQPTPAIPGQLLQPPLPFPTLPQPTVQQPTQPQPPPVLTLPDDVPNPSQTKMGPLGQIAGGKSTNSASKKKPKKEKEPTLPGTGGGGVPGVVSGLVGGGMNGVITMSVGNGGGIQQMTVAGSQPGNVGGTIGLMQASTMSQAGAPGQIGTPGEAPVVPKKRGGPGRGKKGKMSDLTSRVAIATAS